MDNFSPFDLIPFLCNHGTGLDKSLMCVENYHVGLHGGKNVGLLDIALTLA